MLDAKEIDAAIAELEYRESSYSSYQKLASLYIIRDKMQPEAQKPRAEQAPTYPESEFLRAVSEKNPAAAWAVIDELMDALRLVNRRAYDGVMREIGRL